MKWTVHTDGACLRNPGPSGAGVHAVDEEGANALALSRFLGQGTNNWAEYKAIRIALEEAKAAGVSEVDLFCDSEVVVRQITGKYACRCPHLGAERLAIVSLIGDFDHVSIDHIYDEQNGAADRLAKSAARRGYNP